MLIVFLIILIVAVTMFAEARISRAHEQQLRAAGAFEPAGDVYAVMHIAYPAGFLLMAIEAGVRHRTSAWLLPGAIIFVLAKVLKWWAMASLGTRWTFRVLVLPNAALVHRGPYRLLRHPNYVAVLGEIVSVAMMLGVPWTGTAACLGFGSLLWMRIQVEERALSR